MNPSQIAHNSCLFERQSFPYSITLQVSKIGSNIDDTITEELQRELGDKCTAHGFISAESISIIKRSVGVINTTQRQGSIDYKIVYEADVCRNPDGREIYCQVINTNKLGIMAEFKPLSIVLAKQHHEKKKEFDNKKVGDIIMVKIMGSRYELRDDQINAIAVLV